MDNEMKLIYVEWEDAYSREGWQTSHDLDMWKEHKFMVQQSGFVYDENKDYMIIAGGINPGDEVGELQFKQTIKIPSSWVGRRVDLTNYVKLCLGLNEEERQKLDDMLTREVNKQSIK